jgi:hypothetical protein
MLKAKNLDLSKGTSNKILLSHRLQKYLITNLNEYEKIFKMVMYM